MGLRWRASIESKSVHLSGEFPQEVRRRLQESILVGLEVVLSLQLLDGQLQHHQIEGVNLVRFGVAENQRTRI